MSAWDELLPHLRELLHLRNVMALLEYDQAVSMPPRGGEGRAATIATIEGIFHARLTDTRIGDLLDELEAADSLDQDQKASTRVLRRDFDRATKVPPDLVKALAETRGLAYQAWTEARPKDDFSILQPHLDKMVALKREEADAVGWEDERYDALLDEYEPGMTAREVEEMFTTLVDGLRPLAESIIDAAPDKPTFINDEYDENQQKVLCDWLVEALGFDTHAGRLDLSPHPFTYWLGVGDTRQTTRTEPRSFLNAVYAAIHETGHALYEQGIPVQLRGLPVGEPPSLGLHESQSRLWENQMGRSRSFTDFLLPHVKERFPQLGSIGPDDFHSGANYPERSLIRVHADEVTYNLHVALRFEIELALFRDELEVDDLPGAFDDAMEKHVGIRPDNQRDGVLQDMHWSVGALGYFPTYTLGNLYAAAFYALADSQIDDLSSSIRAGDFVPLLDWLRERIHSQAFRYPAKELAEKILGAPITPQPFLDYLGTKYGELYGRTFG